MKRTCLAAVLTLTTLVVFQAQNALAEDKRVADAEPAPTLPKEFSKEKPSEGLTVAAQNAVLVCPRGGFAIPFNNSLKGSVAFEYGAKGYDSKQTYLGFQNNFHYWKVDGYQAILAVRNTATGGKFDMYFFPNGGSTPVFYSQGVPYPGP